MITYEVALKKAKEVKPKIDTCTEYENGYVFGCKTDDEYVGGGHVPVVILKEDGRAVNMPYFIIKIGTGQEIGEFEVK